MTDSSLIHCNEEIDTTKKIDNIKHISYFDFIFDFQTSIILKILNKLVWNYIFFKKVQKVVLVKRK